MEPEYDEDEYDGEEEIFLNSSRDYIRTTIDTGEIARSPRPTTADRLKAKLKVRHLSKSERDVLHRPSSDWKESNRGDVCRSSHTLVIEDIIQKHNVQ